MALIENPWQVESVEAFTFLCCPECVYRSQEETSFQAHAVQNHPKSAVLFNCELSIKQESDDKSVISESTENEDLLAEDNVILDEPRDFKCSICDSEFAKLKDLQAHKSTEHAKTIIKKKQKILKPIKIYKCNYCKSDFKSLKGLKYHKTNTCSQTKAEQKDGEVVSCPKCGQEFSALRYLVSHYRSFHGGLPPGFEDRQQYICDQCSQAFLSESSLQNHILKQHVKSDHKMYCHECKQEFKESRYLIQHYKVSF